MKAEDNEKEKERTQKEISSRQKMGRKKNEMRQDIERERERAREPIVTDKGKPFCLSKPLDAKPVAKKNKYYSRIYTSATIFVYQQFVSSGLRETKGKRKKYSKEKRNKTTEVSYRM